MKRSLRAKVALGFSALAIVLLLGQALGVRLFAEAQEERLIDALIHDDMISVLRSYRTNPALLPPFDARLDGHVSSPDAPELRLPGATATLPDGTHEIIVDGQEIHVAIQSFDGKRLYRVYDFNAYEKHFKRVINALMAGTGVFALLTIWLGYALAGLLVRQVAGLARQVKALRHNASASIDASHYDEAELAALIDAFNDYRRRMAEMIEREKEFTGNVSHELRTPLTAIKTSCELIDTDPGLSGKSRARLAQVEQAADGMRDTVNALLLLAREESSAPTQPTPLAPLVRDALEPFVESLRAGSIEAIVDIDPAARAEVNSAALAIVLNNLLDNAVRHTFSGHIRISWHSGSLVIEDTGAGIATDALPQVFERFYSERDGQADAIRGFGIGLSIVRRLCERYGWTIALESEPERGTRVTLQLPPAG